MPSETSRHSLRDDLLTLLEALPPSERTIPILAGIRTRLIQEPDGDTLRKYLGEIAQVITDARAAAEEDRREREEQLTQVRERLQQMDARLATFSAGGEAEAASSLRAAMQELNECVSALQRELTPAMAQNLLDPLTGIANRLAFEQRLRIEYARWKRYDAPLVLQWWGIDEFESIRQRRGRQVADMALMMVARLIAANLRETDFVARYEHEQFAVLLPETQLDDSHSVAERLRKRLSAARFHHRAEPVVVTLSCGYSAFVEGDTVPDVLARVRASYARARASGAGGYSAGG